MLDLEPRHLDLVKHILHQRVPGARAWAFGSRVKGTARRFNDLDLAIATDGPIAFHTLAVLDEDLADSDLPIKVDVVDLFSLSPDFRALVERDGVRVA